MPRTLLIIDAQENMLADPSAGGVPSSHLIKQAIEQILVSARSSSPTNRPRIIHIRNNGGKGEPDEPNTPGWQLVLPALDGESVVDKTKPNAFEGTNLGDLIPSGEKEEVVVVGMQSEFCVHATCTALVERGNEVVLVSGAHATYDEGDRKAVEVERGVEEELRGKGVRVEGLETVLGWFSA